MGCGETGVGLVALRACRGPLPSRTLRFLTNMPEILTPTHASGIQYHYVGRSKGQRGLMGELAGVRRCSRGTALCLVWKLLGHAEISGSITLGLS